MTSKLVGLVSIILVLGASIAGATETIVDLEMPVIQADAGSGSSCMP